MSDLQRVKELAKLLIEQKKVVENLEAQLAQAKRDYARIETEDLPELMREVELQSITTDTGEIIEIVDEVQCGITEEKRPAAHRWLVNNGFGGLIKTEVIAKFGKGEYDKALEAASQIGGIVTESVHAATLKSFVKEQMKAGQNVPSDLFGIFPYSKAKLKSKK